MLTKTVCNMNTERNEGRSRGLRSLWLILKLKETFYSSESALEVFRWEGNPALWLWIYCSCCVTRGAWLVNVVFLLVFFKQPFLQKGIASLLLNALFYLDCIRARVIKLTLWWRPHAMSEVMWPMLTVEAHVGGDCNRVEGVGALTEAQKWVMM